MNESNPSGAGTTFPRAKIDHGGRSWWLWLLPLAAAVFVAALIVTYVVRTGPLITLRVSDGHGVKAGDLLRCRGIAVGQVESVMLNEDLSGVVLRIRLETGASDIARAGSRFWVVRPQLDLSGVGGLETIAGPRYLAVLPGRGGPRDDFIALENPPVVENIEADALEVVLVGPVRSGLHAGAPVLYRGVPIGVILSVGLSSDAASVEARAYIEPQYTALVRTNSQFWSVSGANADLGITGLSVTVESIQTLLVGGVAVATPNTPGNRPSTGRRYTLYAEPDDDWLEWSPSLAVGVGLLPTDATVPDMQRASIRRRGLLWGTKRQSAGWLLPTTEGLIGPADLLTSDDEEATLEVAGGSRSLAELRVAPLGALARAPMFVDSVSPFPAARMRKLEAAEDLLVVTGTDQSPIPVAASRLERAESDDDDEESTAVADGWLIDGAISFDPAMHGAAVMARRDGSLVGLLVLSDEGAAVAELP